ncbi:hypothetical protein I4U23_006376 [Adineta vaga]|nr:hypothetical protein I4U23_006376 [Adineta vaga]
MTEKLIDTMHREWHLTNSDANNNDHNSHLSHPHSLSHKLADHNNQKHSLPLITTTDYSDPTELAVLHVAQALFRPRKSSDTGYDTEGGIPTSDFSPKHHRQHHHHSTNNVYESLVSPKLPTRRSVLQHPAEELPSFLSQRRASHEHHLTVQQSASFVQNHSDKDLSHRDNNRRRHIRHSRRIPQSPSSSSAENHEVYGTHASTIPRHHGALANVSTRRPLRLVFMRHSERVNQALGAHWFMKAFESGSYKVYDPLLPEALPKRGSHHAYEYDVPLTINGLKNARHTGRAMFNAHIVPDVCLSSSALRCIQTSERVLTGMNSSARIPIRVEPGLFECPHHNYKVAESFMTKTELTENGYNIKLEYKTLIPKINAPESLDEYFDRSVTVMHGIVNRYAHRGGTILIVTHAPGLLALTDAIKGIRPNKEMFYRTVATYPPLALYIAEYDGARWKHSEQPFSLTSLA